MAYQCPKCGGTAKREATGGAGGLIGVLISGVFGAFQCEKCGIIKKSEFPPEDRRKIALFSALMMLGALGLLVVLALVISLMD